MAKKKRYVLEITADELYMLRDAVDILSPDNDAARKVQDVLFKKLHALQPATKPEVIISVRGGIVSHVFSTDKTTDVTVLDYDGDAADDNEKIWKKEILPRENKDLFTVV